MPPATSPANTTTFYLLSRLRSRPLPFALTPAVAVLSPVTSSPSLTRFVSKIPYSPRHLDAELHAYRVLSPLQVVLVPCYCGTATTTHGLVVLLTGFIASGTTISVLRGPRGWARVEALKENAKAAVQRIHELGVLHRDAKGRNLLIYGEGGEERVVDFDVARVFVNNLETLGRREWGFC